MNRVGGRAVAGRPRATADHSGAGIAAFIIALVTMFLAMFAVPLGLLLQILPRVLRLSTDGGEPAAVVIVVLVAREIVAAGLAFAALRREGHSRVFPIIALVVVGLTVLAGGLIVGLAALVFRA